MTASVPRFVITGTGRSGTMGMSVLLNRAGIRTAFEEFFCARDFGAGAGRDYAAWLAMTRTMGEVSSLAAPYLPCLSGEIVVLHQVRNPVAALASLMGEWAAISDAGGRIRYFPNIKFNRRHLRDLSPDDDPLPFYLKYWLLWNELIEPWAHWRFRIEDVGPTGETWPALLARLGVVPGDQTASAIGRYTRDCNAGKRDPRVMWRNIPASQLKHRILQKALAYGYSEAELDAYCPYPTDPRHYHKEFLPVNSAQCVSIQEGLERFYRTPGNISAGLVEMYAAAQVVGKIGVEVGCAWGESAEIACNFLGHLYCVDAWGPGFEGNEPHFDERMAAVPNHTKIKEESHVACADFPDESLDIAYIDAMHDYESVKRDLLCWFPKVKMGGWIAGHDYDLPEMHEGVIRAVDEVLGAPALRFRDSSFLFRKTPELTRRVAALFPRGYVPAPPLPAPPPEAHP